MGGQTLERSVRQDAPRVILYLDTDDPAAHPGPRLSFAQANPAQNARMVRLVHDLLGANPAHRILDLYAGDGNLTATLAPRVRAVVGADIDPVAIDRANTRTPLNARYLAGDVVRVLESLLADAQTFDGVVLDPPRAGAREACRRIADTGAARVVYVSCNPATLARDLDVLSGSGYRVVRVVPVDLFPQTAHVECVTLLERNVGSEGTESGQKLA